MKIITVEHTRVIEAELDRTGTSYDELMQRAGRATADFILSQLNNISHPKLTILIGPGNNGGDGLVAGLFIAQDHAQAEVRFYLLKRRSEDDTYVTIAGQAGLFIAYAEDDSDKRVLRNMVASSDVIVDAIFGIGVRLPLRDEAARILRSVRQGLSERRRELRRSSFSASFYTDIPQSQAIKVFALDCVSGTDADTGQIDSNALIADATITFLGVKPGIITFPAAEHTGEIVLAGLGIPSSHQLMRDEPDEYIDADIIRDRLPRRPLNGHKGSFGRVMIVGGSPQYIGAPGLSARGAYRSGAGLVCIGTASSLIGTLASALPETIWLHLPHDGGIINNRAIDVLRGEIHQYDVLLIGPGMTQDKSATEFLRGLLTSPWKSGPHHREIGFMAKADQEDIAETESPKVLPSLVLDADALNILAQEENWWQSLPANCVLTPHPGEFLRLIGMDDKDAIQSMGRWQLVRDCARRWNQIVVLKGAHTLIGEPGGKTYTMPFKTSALATAGTGDVLAGLIAGFIAQGMSGIDAALMGTFVHGMAGILAEQELGAHSVTASDVVAHIACALKALLI